MSDNSEKSEKWTKIQRQFMLFLALPKSARKPKTQRAFADQYGVSEDTLSIWKRLPNFADEVATLARELVKDDVPDVLGTIRQKAKEGIPYHTNIFLAMAGLSSDVANANSQRVFTEKDLSDDELLRIATTSRE